MEEKEINKDQKKLILVMTVALYFIIFSSVAFAQAEDFFGYTAEEAIDRTVQEMQS